MAPRKRRATEDTQIKDCEVAPVPWVQLGYYVIHVEEVGVPISTLEHVGIRVPDSDQLNPLMRD